VHTKHLRRACLPQSGRAIVLLVLIGILHAFFSVLSVRAASSFAHPAFQQQWSAVEDEIPNFWGPLQTARDGQNEPYADAPGGQRLVQYFDKARMELTDPNTGAVTNGLLTVELKSGNLQLGDSSFVMQGPAAVGIAGDPNGAGPTYASLGQLPERISQASGAVNLRFNQSSNAFTQVAPSTDPATVFTAYYGDPGGRFGQNVPRAFVDFLQSIPGGYLGVLGYPISPAFSATVPVGGQAKDVIIQAFQRKVLTYTPTNPSAFRVEFGNIGQHYYAWRYSGSPTPAPTPKPKQTATPPPPLQLSQVTVAYQTITSFAVSWQTNVPASSELQYGTTTSNMRTIVVRKGVLTRAHSVTVQNLALSTLYHFKVQSRDMAGKLVADNQDRTASTNVTGNLVDTNIIGTPTFRASPTTITVNWTTFGVTKSRIEYVADSKQTPGNIQYNQFRLGPNNDPAAKQHTVTAVALTPHTLYHFRIVSTLPNSAVAGASDDPNIVGETPITLLGYEPTRSAMSASTDGASLFARNVFTDFTAMTTDGQTNLPITANVYSDSSCTGDGCPSLSCSIAGQQSWATLIIGPTSDLDLNNGAVALEDQDRFSPVSAPTEPHLFPGLPGTFYYQITIVVDGVGSGSSEVNSYPA
jgi:hypothetical protein